MCGCPAGIRQVRGCTRVHTSTLKAFRTIDMPMHPPVLAGDMHPLAMAYSIRTLAPVQGPRAASLVRNAIIRSVVEAPSAEFRAIVTDTRSTVVPLVPIDPSPMSQGHWALTGGPGVAAGLWGVA